MPSYRRVIELFGGRALDLGGRTLVMGVINVTPDSFYPGSRTPRPDAAVERGLALIEAGADILDIGGESTRPGSGAVGEAEEITRVLPVVEAIRKASQIALSVDTKKATVAEYAIAAGADIVNDVSALAADPGMPELIAKTGAIAILMHMRGTPESMQEHTHYDDVMLEVKAELGLRIANAVRSGIRPDRLWLDPGIGFAKRPRQCLEILNRLREFEVFETPIVIGASRKSFLGRLLGEDNPAHRLEGSLAIAAVAALAGVHVIRTHDVAETRRVTTVIDAVRNPTLLEK